MHFSDNPFFILDAKPCDNDAKIMELAVKCGLHQDSERGRGRCREAKVTLMNSRKRIDAEIAWMPVKTREQVKEICELLKSSEANLSALESLRQVEDFLGDGELIPIAKCNVLAAGMHCLPRYSPDQVATCTLEIACSYEDIDIEQVRAAINANRETAGSPIANLQDITEALRESQARYYQRVMTSVIDKLSATECAEAMTQIVSEIADENQLPRLITTLVKWYIEDEKVRKSLKEHDTKVRRLVGQLGLAADANRPDSELVPLVCQLIQEVKNWDVIAQPIQLSKSSQGSSHDESEALEERVRDLAMHLFDAHDKLNFCMQLIKTLQDAFAEVKNISKHLSVIMSRLNATAQNRERCGRRKIESQVKKLHALADKQQPDSDLSQIVNQLREFIKHWKTSAQLCKKYYADFYKKGVIDLVKKLADDLRNEHGEFDVSRQLCEMLQEEFAQDGEFAARVDEPHNGLEAAEDSLAKNALETIESHVKKLRACADAKNLDSNWDRMLNELIQSIKDWKLLAKPIEAYSTGYLTLVHLVVGLAFQLRIPHRKLDFSRVLFNRLQEEFTEVHGYATSIAKYSRVLEDAERALGGITKHINKMRVAAVAEIPDMVNQLIQSVKEWKDRAQPIKPFYENYSEGARLVRDLAFDLRDDHGRFDDSLKLFKTLHKEFAEISEIADSVNDALAELEAAESARRHIENQVEVVYRKHFHPNLSSMVDQLIQTVRGWTDLAPPMKVYCGDYCNVAKLVLDLAKKLWKKGRHCSSGRLRDMVQDIFGEIPEIDTLLADEAKERNETEKKHAPRNARKRARWRR